MEGIQQHANTSRAHYEGEQIVEAKDEANRSMDDVDLAHQEKDNTESDYDDQIDSDYFRGNGSQIE